MAQSFADNCFDEKLNFDQQDSSSINSDHLKNRSTCGICNKISLKDDLITCFECGLGGKFKNLFFFFQIIFYSNLFKRERTKTTFFE